MKELTEKDKEIIAESFEKEGLPSPWPSPLSPEDEAYFKKTHEEAEKAWKAKHHNPDWPPFPLREEDTLGKVWIYLDSMERALRALILNIDGDPPFLYQKQYALAFREAEQICELFPKAPAPPLAPDVKYLTKRDFMALKLWVSTIRRNTTASDLPFNDLNDTEKEIITALEKVRLTGERIAAKTKPEHAYQSNFKNTLSSMVKRGILGNIRGRNGGYFLKPEYYYFLESWSNHGLGQD